MCIAADCKTWTKAHVQQWATQREMHFAIKPFSDNDVTGVVLADLNHVMLEEIGITKLIQRTQVLKEIALLQSSAGVVCGVAFDRFTDHRPRTRHCSPPRRHETQPLTCMLISWIAVAGAVLLALSDDDDEVVYPAAGTDAALHRA